MSYAPIALFTYCRADKTQRAVESLLRNTEAKATDLFIFSDGPKVYPEDEKKTEEKCKGVEENRQYIHTITGFKSVSIVERDKNWGLANSLIAGISDVISRFGRIIVVEDDLVLSPYFLSFMNEALEKYKDDDRVAAVSGYVYPTGKTLPQNFFLRYFNCWGWATWDRAWALLDTDAKHLLRKMRFKKNAFDVGGGLGAYGNLICQKYGLVDSWWVRLYASFFLADKLTLYPGDSLSENDGNDATGTHTNGIPDPIVKVPWAHGPVPVLKERVVENSMVFNIYKQYFLSKDTNTDYKSIFSRIKSFIRRLLYIDAR